MYEFHYYCIKSKYENKSELLFTETGNETMKDETGGVVTEEFVGSKPKIYSFLVYNNEHKKVKSVNKNVVAIMNIKMYCWIKVYKTLNE